MQRTALRAHKIGAFLKVRIARPPYRSIRAPPLMPNPFGGHFSVSSNLNLHYLQTYSLIIPT